MSSRLNLVILDPRAARAVEFAYRSTGMSSAPKQREALLVLAMADVMRGDDVANAVTMVEQGLDDGRFLADQGRPPSRGGRSLAGAGRGASV
jgi:hypothetical protein